MSSYGLGACAGHGGGYFLEDLLPLVGLLS